MFQGEDDGFWEVGLFVTGYLAADYSRVYLEVTECFWWICVVAFEETPIQDEVHVRERYEPYTNGGLVSISSDGSAANVHLVLFGRQINQRVPLVAAAFYHFQLHTELFSFNSLTSISIQFGKGSQNCSLNGFYDDCCYGRAILAVEVGWSGNLLQNPAETFSHIL